MALIRPSTFFRNVSTPTTAIGDFITVFRQAGKNRWRIAVAAAAVTTGSSRSCSRRKCAAAAAPHVTYITVRTHLHAWPKILIVPTSIRMNKKCKDRLAAQGRARGAAPRHVQDAGPHVGMDVDAIEEASRGRARGRCRRPEGRDRKSHRRPKPGPPPASESRAAGDDRRRPAAAASLAARGWPLSHPNPAQRAIHSGGRARRRPGLDSPGAAPTPKPWRGAGRQRRRRGHALRHAGTVRASQRARPGLRRSHRRIGPARVVVGCAYPDCAPPGKAWRASARRGSPPTSCLRPKWRPACRAIFRCDGAGGPKSRSSPPPRSMAASRWPAGKASGSQW